MPDSAPTFRDKNIVNKLTRIILTSYARFFGKAALAPWNNMLLQLGLRGLGVLNYQTPSLTGESNFLRRYLRHLESPHVIDVGANVGDYAHLVRKFSESAKIICFEPHPANLELLRSREDIDAEIVNLALSDKPGFIELFDYEDNDGSSHASVYRDVTEEIHGRRSISHTVKAETLDQYCNKKRIKCIDLLKIDAEGHELDILRGAEKLLANDAIKVIHFEFNEMNIISGVFLRDFRLLLKGYTLYRLLPKGWLKLKCDRSDEIFAYQNIVAINNQFGPAMTILGQSK